MFNGASHPNGSIHVDARKVPVGVGAPERNKREACGKQAAHANVVKVGVRQDKAVYLTLQHQGFVGGYFFLD
jgi:hypothetical protein